MAEWCIGRNLLLTISMLLLRSSIWNWLQSLYWCISVTIERARKNIKYIKNNINKDKKVQIHKTIRMCMKACRYSNKSTFLDRRGKSGVFYRITSFYSFQPRSLKLCTCIEVVHMLYRLFKDFSHFSILNNFFRTLADAFNPHP